MLLLQNRIEEFIRHVDSTGYRGLLVVTSVTSEVLRRIIEVLGSRNRRVLIVTSSEATTFHGIDVVKPNNIVDVLGTTYSHVIVDTDSRIDANTVAAVAETIGRGGVLVLVSRRDWTKWCPLGYGRYCRYLKKRISDARQVLVVDFSNKKIIVDKTINEKAPTIPRPHKTGLPLWLEELVATIDQAEAIKEMYRLLKTENAISIILTGNRGRGKTSAIGLLLSLMIARKEVGEVAVVASSLQAVQSLFVHLARGLRKSGIKYKAWGSRRIYQGIKGGWFKVYFKEYTDLLAQPFTVIDEAATIGIARVRRIAHRSRKTIISTTIHGYEGSGKAFLHRLLSNIPNPHTIVLEQPIRYPASDPLEEWIYHTFMLNVEPEIKELQHDKIIVEQVNKDLLIEHYNLLRSIYSVLVLAHYRNMPNDLVLLLESNHEIFVAKVGENVVAVAQVNIDDKMLKDLIERNYGVLLPINIARIVRIAVVPSLQRRGIGSLLLREIEGIFKETAGAIGAVFSNHDVIPFWLRNGYMPFYISPRFNRITGEKNVAVIKPLKDEVKATLMNILAEFRYRLVLAASSVYRDLPAEEIVDILKNCGYDETSSNEMELKSLLTNNQVYRLKAFLGSRLHIESVQDTLLLLLAKAAYKCCLSLLDRKQILAMVFIVAQGKPLWEAYNIRELKDENIEALIRDGTRLLLDRCISLGEQA